MPLLPTLASHFTTSKSCSISPSLRSPDRTVITGGDGGTEDNRRVTVSQVVKARPVYIKWVLCVVDKCKKLSVLVGKITFMSDVCLSCCWKVYKYTRCVSQLLLKWLQVCKMCVSVVVERVAYMSDICLSCCWNG